MGNDLSVMNADDGISIIDDILRIAGIESDASHSLRRVNDSPYVLLPSCVAKSRYGVEVVGGGLRLWLLLPGVGAEKTYLKQRESLGVSSLIEAAASGATKVGIVKLSCGDEVRVFGRCRGTVLVSIGQSGSFVRFDRYEAEKMSYLLRETSYKVWWHPFEE